MVTLGALSCSRKEVGNWGSSFKDESAAWMEGNPSVDGRALVSCPPVAIGGAGGMHEVRRHARGFIVAYHPVKRSCEHWMSTLIVAKVIIGTKESQCSVQQPGVDLTLCLG